MCRAAGPDLVVCLLRHHHSVVGDAPVQNHCGGMGAAAAFRLNPWPGGRNRPAQQDMRQANQAEIQGDRPNFKAVPAGIGTKSDQLPDTPELFPRDCPGREAANFAGLVGQFMAPRCSDQRTGIGDEELQQREQGDAEDNDRDHRVGASTLAVASRASFGTFKKV